MFPNGAVALNRAFDVDAPEPFWVADIICIRTHEGLLHRAAVSDPFSRRVIGGAMQARTDTNLPLRAPLP